MSYAQLTSLPATQVSLADGIQGTAYGHVNTGTLIWKEGAWTFITTNATNTNEVLANEMIRALVGQKLPRTPGVVNLVTGVHGLFEYVAWTKGRNLYTASGYGGFRHVLNGMDIAISWRNQ